MKKTSVYLEDHHVRRLARLAKLSGTSEADVIRRAIEEYVPAIAGSREFALTGSGAGPGTTIADVLEEQLLEDFGR